MDFLFDDDDDDAAVLDARTSSQQPGEDDENDFVCITCGSRDYYEGDGGALICSQCYTQSQVATQAQSEFDMEEVQALANKSGRGKIIGVRKLRAGHRKHIDKRPLEDYDITRPLPNLDVCLEGFQSVLKGGIRTISQILRFTNEEEEAFMEAVGTVWIHYLEAWKDGADKYGALYPDIRFSMRDNFLAASHKGFIRAVLSQQATETVKKELDDGEVKEVDQQKLVVNESYDDDESSLDDDDDNSVNESQTIVTGIKQEEVTLTVPKKDLETNRRWKALDNLVSKFTNKGREEAALCLKPSMEMVASILWLVLSRRGITPGQMVNWVANGSFPLLNAFDNLLPADEQAKLQFIRSFFGMPRPPNPMNIERFAAHLALASGLESTPEVPQYSSDEEEENEEEEEDDNQSHSTSATSKVPALLRPKLRKRLRFVSMASVPNMISQLVADLGFEQRVLDIALSLIGNPPYHTPKYQERRDMDPKTWLPRPLQRAQPRNIELPEKALGVIVVACKMCPGWESWQYVMPNNNSSSQQQQQQQHRSNSAYNHTLNEEVDIGAATQQRVQRVIPWNEDQFRLCMRNTEHATEYLDFYEDNVFEQRELGTAFPAFSDLLEKACRKERNYPEEAPTTKGNNGSSKNNDENDDDDDNDDDNSTAPITHDEVLLPGMSHVEQRILYKSTSQGFTPYISYPHKEYHTSAPRKEGCWDLTAKLTMAPFHVCYTRLVEYIAYKCHVSAYRIHAFVADLDEEVVYRCKHKKRRKFRDKDAMRRKRNKRNTRKKHEKMRLTAMKEEEANKKRRRVDALPDGMLSQLSSSPPQDPLLAALQSPSHQASQQSQSQYHSQLLADAQDPFSHDYDDDIQYETV